MFTVIRPNRLRNIPIRMFLKIVCIMLYANGFIKQILYLCHTNSFPFERLWVELIYHFLHFFIAFSTLLPFR